MIRVNPGFGMHTVSDHHHVGSLVEHCESLGFVRVATCKGYFLGWMHGRILSSKLRDDRLRRSF